MPTPGYVFRDGLAVPDSELKHGRSQELGEVNPEPKTHTGTSNASDSNINTPSSSSPNGSDPPTDSHALAKAHTDDIGAVQENATDGEVEDMGWREHPENVPMLVGGLPNEELWALVRRFNKQMYHVRATDAPLLGGLDLNIVDEDEFSPDKLRSNVERLYMTVIIGVMGAGNHIARLRSWREPRRTGAFLAAYIIAWLLDFLMPLLFTTFVVLILYPPARTFMFPPAPLALVSSKTGGVKSPPAGVLGSHDSVTGAPENRKGEAVEQEAHNFVTGIGSIALSSAAGKHTPGDPDDDPVDESIPDPTKIASTGAEAKVSAAGGTPDAKHDKTKQPMEAAMWKQMRPVMHVVGDIADGWERFANALSPTKPFPQEKPRLVLASVLVPLIALSLLTTSAMFMKGLTGGIGFGFFADPLIWRGLDFLNKKVPNWQKLLELRNSLLKGVPTNAQLTLTLLRVGEVNKAPLPPPPRSDEPPPSKAASIDGDHITAALDTNHEELGEAIHLTEDQKKEIAEQNQEDAKTQKEKHHHGQKILGFFKGTTHAGVDTKFGVDKARAHVLGTESAKETLGIIPKSLQLEKSGPVDFMARYKGTKGWVYISTSGDVPTVSFSKQATDHTGEEPDAGASWTIAVPEITELKKVGGLGWKGKIVVSWAIGKPIADSLIIKTSSGEEKKLTAIRLREELFNRLISLNGQKWECL